MHIRRLFLAILSISFFWTIGSVLIIIFPPLVKNYLGADEQVASLFTAIFSIGIAIGSVLINRLLKSEVSARFAPAPSSPWARSCCCSTSLRWPGQARTGDHDASEFRVPLRCAALMIVALLGVAITGGMFVVPLYAFLTTTVPKSETARTVAANNIVNSGAMVAGLLLSIGLGFLGVGPAHQLLLVAAMCIVSAWLGWKLHLACDGPLLCQQDRDEDEAGKESDREQP